MSTKCCAQLLLNVKILNIFCMVSSDITTGGSSDLLQNRTHQLPRNMICFYPFHFIMRGKLKILRSRCFLHQNKSQLQWFKEKTSLQSKFCCKLKSIISKQWVHSVVTRREPKTTFPLNFFLMAVLNYSVFLAWDLFCCLVTTPFEKKPFAFSLYISFEESISYRVYSRVDNL